MTKKIAPLLRIAHVSQQNQSHQAILRIFYYLFTFISHFSARHDTLFKSTPTSCHSTRARIIYHHFTNVSRRYRPVSKEMNPDLSRSHSREHNLVRRLLCCYLLNIETTLILNFSIHLYSEMAHTNVVQVLIDKKARVDVMDTDGSSQLHW